MAEITDGQLLDEFVKQGSSASFEQVVRRHMDWVYSCARRLLRDADLAEDVSQAVFILLAGKARALRGHVQLNGWLFRATRYCAANAIKQRIRREHHEREARVMQPQTAGDDEANWREVYPVLDEAVAGLSGADRDAVLLRFYQGKTMAEVGASMGIGEEAAKKRVQRAVKRLRGMMVRKGVTVGAGGLASVMAVQVTQAAPPGLVEAALAASAAPMKATTAGMIAKAVGKLMWWAKAKLAAMLVLGGMTGVATCGTIVYVVVALPVQPNSVTAPVPPSVVSAPSTVFDGLYEKAPGSGPGLSMKIGPNTFAVTAVVRYGADGRPLATDGRGKPLDPSALPLTKIQPPADTSKDIIIVFLQPESERYYIDRLRVFDHITRRYIENVVVTQVPGLSALRLAARPGTIPAQIDLWLDVASYDAANVPISLAAKKDASVVIGGAQVGFEDIRDGQWNFQGGKFTNVNFDMPQTTLRLKATGYWNAGRYQISAVSKSGQKYLSDFFIDLSMDTGPILFFPFSLDQTDHFELRPDAHEPPFFFDGIDLPSVQLPATFARIPQPVIVSEGKQSQVRLPCGAVVELSGISYSPYTGQGWWGVDGRPVRVAALNSPGSVSDDNGRLKPRAFAARLLNAPAGISEMLWQFEPGASWAGSQFNRRESRVVAALSGDSPVTVRVGVAATPWRTLEEFAAEKLPAETQYWPGVIEAPKSTADGVALSTSMVNLPDNMRLVLIDRAGKTQTPNGFSSGGENDKLQPWGYQSIHMKFSGLRLENIRGIRLETRSEEFAAFENVPLQPN